MIKKRKSRRDSERCDIVNRTVSFNIEDPYQANLLTHTDSWINFSGGIKRLIAEDMQGVGAIPKTMSTDKVVQIPASVQGYEEGEWESASGLL